MVQCFRYSVAQEAPARAEERSADSNELPAVTVSGRLHSSKDPPDNSLFAASHHLASKISKIGQHGVPIIRSKGGHNRQNRLMVACPQTGNNSRIASVGVRKRPVRKRSPEPPIISASSAQYLPTGGRPRERRTGFSMLHSMLRGVAGSKHEPLKFLENMLQHVAT
jgi:hypothetical protein